MLQTKTLRPLKNLLLFSGLLTWGLQAKPLRVLTYSSFLGKDSMGAWIQEEFKKSCAQCEVEFVTTSENSGLLGELRRDKRRAKAEIDFVLGLEGQNFEAARSEKLISEGFVFDQSPFAIVINKKLWGNKKLPASWKELPSALEKKLFVQDPHLSQVGVGWLRVIFESKLLALAEAKKIEKRVFPSWSTAYAAFSKGEAEAVWTFLGSEAYHLCHNEKDYVSLPLKEGYPLHQEWVAELSHTKSDRELRKKFSEFLKSEKLQSVIPLKNWMFPGTAGVTLPECFRSLSPQAPALKPASLPLKTLEKWMDEWSL